MNIESRFRQSDDLLSRHEFLKLERRLIPYADALEKTGFDRLIPLLDRKVEQRVFRGLEQCLVQALGKLNPSNQPSQRTPDEEKNIRLEIQELMKKYAEQHGMDPKMMPTMKVIPPDKLYGLAAPLNLFPESMWMMTDFGRAIHVLKNNYPDLYLFLYAGRARESEGTKSRYFRRDILPEKSYRLQVLSSGEETLNTDFDFLAVTSSVTPNNRQIARLLQEKVFRKSIGNFAEVKQGTSRPGFERVDFGIPGALEHDEEGILRLVKSTSFGHVFFPGFEGVYNQNNPLLPFLMANARVDIPILLIPHRGRDGPVMIWGLAVDFFRGFEDVARSRLMQQLWLGHHFSVAFYPFPEFTFPIRFPQQLFFNLRYLFRTIAWGDKQLIVRTNYPTLEEDLHNSKLKDLARATQFYLTNHVIYSLAFEAAADKYFMGTFEQRLRSGFSLLEDIAMALDGDPIATILRLLPAGHCFTEKEQVFDTNVNIYGLGIIDKKGIWPVLGQRIEENPELEKRLVSRLKAFIEMMNLEEKINVLTNLILTLERNEKIRPGSVDTDRLSKLSQRKDLYSVLKKYILDKEPSLKNIEFGRKLFFDFLFEIAGGDPTKVLELLRPVWCSEKDWGDICKRKRYIEGLIEIDDRFRKLRPLSERNIKRTKDVMTSFNQPFTLLDVANRYELRFNGRCKRLPEIIEAITKEGLIIELKIPGLCSLYGPLKIMDKLGDPVMFLKERVRRFLRDFPHSTYEEWRRLEEAVGLKYDVFYWLQREIESEEKQENKT